MNTEFSQMSPSQQLKHWQQILETLPTTTLTTTNSPPSDKTTKRKETPTEETHPQKKKLTEPRTTKKNVQTKNDIAIRKINKRSTFLLGEGVISS